jgi:hypothetical protein
MRSKTNPVACRVSLRYNGRVNRGTTPLPLLDKDRPSRGFPAGALETRSLAHLDPRRRPVLLPTTAPSRTFPRLSIASPSGILIVYKRYMILFNQ